MPLVPAALLLLYGAWCGTFAGGASAAGAGIGYAAILAAVLLVPEASDPLRLGRAGRLIPLALWIAVAASAWASPVPRAGRVGLVLLPAFLAVPAVVERCWGDPRGRRLGLRAIACVTGIVALVALALQWRLGLPRAGPPLGHHNLLAGWLVAVLPLALLPLRERGVWRAVAAAAGLAVLLAVVASRSLLGAAALGVEALLCALWLRRWHRLMVPAALLVLALQLPRVAAVFAGEDPSAHARLVYLDAGWRGLLERPLLGWGPGSVPLTIAEFLRPLPGVNPPSEVLGDLHSLPLQILYELGATGFLLTLGTAALFLRRRVGERDSAEDPALLAAGLIGLLGAAVTRLGGASLAITALPMAAAIAAGAALAARPRGAAGPDPPGTPAARWPGRVYALAAILVLLPLLRAAGLYDRAARAVPAVAAVALAEAIDRDPGFALYRARRAWLEAAPDRAAAAREALRAAEDARAVAPLWLQAGRLGRLSGEPWAGSALERAAALDPLGASAPFELAQLLAATPGPRAALWSARALLAEPRFLQAVFWRDHPELRGRAVRAIELEAGVDAGWREAFVACAAEPDPAGGVGFLGLDADRHSEPARSFSLHAFRRHRWPVTLAPVEILSGGCGEKLPPATTLGTTKAAVFVTASR